MIAVVAMLARDLSRPAAARHQYQVGDRVEYNSVRSSLTMLFRFRARLMKQVGARACCAAGAGAAGAAAAAAAAAGAAAGAAAAAGQATYGRWEPGVVEQIHADGTVTLDIKEYADIDLIRPADEGVRPAAAAGAARAARAARVVHRSPGRQSPPPQGRQATPSGQAASPRKWASLTDHLM
jgi:hypothetical protein